jgi:hypothetical protein
MTTQVPQRSLDQHEAGSPNPPFRWDRIVAGLLLAAAGTGWLIAAFGAPVPWRLAPSVALVVVGLALLLSLAGGRGRGGLVAIGVAMLVLAGAVGIGADRFVGPLGERTVAPGAADWPSGTTLAAGTVLIDLTRTPPPPIGRLEVHLGAGTVTVRVPDSTAVRVESRIAAGAVVLDGRQVREGIGLTWVDPRTPGAPVTVAVDMGAGTLEVHRVRA